MQGGNLNSFDPYSLPSVVGIYAPESDGRLESVWNQNYPGIWSAKVFDHTLFCCGAGNVDVRSVVFVALSLPSFPPGEWGSKYCISIKTECFSMLLEKPSLSMHRRIQNTKTYTR